MHSVTHPLTIVGRRSFSAALAALATVVLASSTALSTALVGQPPGAYHDDRELPAGVAGERIRELIEVLGSNDPQRVRTLVEQRFGEEFRTRVPIERHLQVFAEVWEQSRGFELYGVRRYETERPPNQHVVIGRNRLTGAWEAFTIDLEPEPPHRIAGLQFSRARPPSDLPPQPPLTVDEAAAELAAFVERLAEADAFSGAVLLERNGKVVYRAAFGPASRSFDVPNRVDTRFNLGSMNKMFTSVAVLQLVQQGKVALDEPIARYLPDGWLADEVAAKIQVRHLLTHTSGLGSYFDRGFFQSSRELYRELVDYKPLIEGETPQFEPGTRWRYSNTGMFLLGFVIEKASGENYFEYIRRHVYGPAGMSRSDSFDMDRPVPDLAIGYSKENGEWRNNLFQHVIRGGPAGGGFSTVDDLLAFARALREHRLLDADHTSLALSPKPELGSPDYGYGFQIDGEPGHRVVGHGGGFPGISSNLDMFLDSGWNAVVLSNTSGGADPVQARMRELVARVR